MEANGNLIGKKDPKIITTDTSTVDVEHLKFQMG